MKLFLMGLAGFVLGIIAARLYYADVMKDLLCLEKRFSTLRQEIESRRKAAIAEANAHVAATLKAILEKL